MWLSGGKTTRRRGIATRTLTTKDQYGAKMRYAKTTHKIEVLTQSTYSETDEQKKNEAQYTDNK